MHTETQEYGKGACREEVGSKWSGKDIGEEGHINQNVCSACMKMSKNKL